MKFTKISGICSVLALTTVVSPFTQANEAGWYLGANAGRSEADIDERRIFDNLLGSGFSQIDIDGDNSDTGYKLFGGYQFNRNLAIEGGYFDLGEFDYRATTVTNGNPGTLNGQIKLKGINLDLIGFVPLTNKLSLLGRVGVNYAEAKDKFGGTGSVNVLNPRAEERDTNMKLGVGMQYAFTETLAMRLETERYRINDAVGNSGDIDLVSVGLVYRFGAPVAPTTVASMPEPTPEPVVAPPPQRFEKHTLSANELFAFDSSAVLQPQAKLDEIAKALKGGGSPDEIIIVGYTDHLGSDDYNQKLSERRALAVKNYLIAKGIKSDRLGVEGRGETSPVVTCNDQSTSALINCLKPNRRVEIENITIMRAVAK